MKTAFLGFLPTVVDCQEKMLLALQMIWPYSGLVLVLYVIEKNEFLPMVYEIALSLHALCEFVASRVCQLVKKQAGPFKPVNMSGWVEATSG